MYLKYNDTSVPIVSAEVDRSLEERKQMQAVVQRDLFDDSELVRGVTEIGLVENRTDNVTDGEFAGVYRDVNRNGPTAEVIVESYERYAIDAKPVGGGVRFTGVDDSTIVSNLLTGTNLDVGAVDPLSIGTIETVETNETFVFSHTSRAAAIRKVVNAGSGEVRYNNDKTVDYVDQLGSDRTVVLGPDSKNVVGSIEVRRKGESQNISHVRVIGAGEGKNQIVTEATADWYDPSTDTERWKTYPNKDIAEETTLQNYANALIQDLNEPDEVEIKLTVTGLDVELGDRFPVQYAEQNVDGTYRVVEMTERYVKGTVEYDCLLSSRDDSRQKTALETRKDSERYNKAFEGTNVSINTSGGRQPVNSANNYLMRIYYPAEVKYEHRLNVRVMGLPYRAYSSGAASSGGYHSHDVTIDIPDHDHEVDIDIPDHDHGVDIPVPSHSHGIDYEYADTGLADGHDHQYTRIADITTEIYDDIVESTTSDDGGSEFLTETSDDGGGYFSTETTDSATPEHTHDPQPGIIEFNEYPSNCDVLVNGSSVGVSLGDGSGTFTQSVDVTGQLQEGAVNTIEITSDTLGHIQAFIEGDVYRQILGNG